MWSFTSTFPTHIHSMVLSHWNNFTFYHLQHSKKYFISQQAPNDFPMGLS